MLVMTELSCRWFVSANGHILCNQDIAKNGFKKAGITEALEKHFPDSFFSNSELTQQLHKLLYILIENQLSILYLTAFSDSQIDSHPTLMTGSTV